MCSMYRLDIAVASCSYRSVSYIICWTIMAISLTLLSDALERIASCMVHVLCLHNLFRRWTPVGARLRHTLSRKPFCAQEQEQITHLRSHPSLGRSQGLAPNLSTCQSINLPKPPQSQTHTYPPTPTSAHSSPGIPAPQY